jgi:hypothetical protein
VRANNVSLFFSSWSTVRSTGALPVSCPDNAGLINKSKTIADCLGFNTNLPFIPKLLIRFHREENRWFDIHHGRAGSGAIIVLFRKQGNAGSRTDCRLLALLKHNPALYALCLILSGPKAEMEKQEYLQHNPCHIFVTSMLTQEYNKSQL